MVKTGDIYNRNLRKISQLLLILIAPVLIAGCSGTEIKGKCERKFGDPQDKGSCSIEVTRTLGTSMDSEALGSIASGTLVDFGLSNVAIPNQSSVSSSVRLLLNNQLVASRSFNFGIHSKIMVPLDPQAIITWADQYTYDKAKLDIPEFDIQSHLGTNTLISKFKIDGQIQGTSADSWFCELPPSGGNFFCQDQIGGSSL